MLCKYNTFCYGIIVEISTMFVEEIISNLIYSNRNVAVIKINVVLPVLYIQY